MNEYDFTESMMQAMADKLTPKLLAGMQECIAPVKDEIRRLDRKASIALAASFLAVVVVGVALAVLAII